MQFILDEASGSGSGHTSDAESEFSASQPPSSPPPVGNFRINAQRFFLTWPRSNWTPDFVLDTLNSIRPITKAIACLELHEDGEPHVHAAVEFSAKVNSVNRRIFDIEGRHPNIQTCRNWRACCQYVDKEGALEVGFIGAASTEDVMGSGIGTGGDPFAVCEAAVSYREWVTHCLRHRISSTYCSIIWDTVRGSQAPTLHANEPLPNAVTNVQLRTYGWSDAVRTLVICGPSGVGKTSWARAHAPVPALIVTDIDDLATYDHNVHRSIIFDEIRCTGARDHNGRWVGAWPLQSQIKLVSWDHPNSIRIRYKLARIPAHVPKVFTCTDTICFTYDEQVDRRISILNLYTDREIAGLWGV